MTPISFFVPGNPKGLKRHRSYTTRAGIHVNVDPNKDDKMDFLAKAMLYRPAEPIDGPLCLWLICVFPRPKAHFGTGRNAGVLKESAPFWYVSTPDCDNVAKFVGDALNGIFWSDDRRLVEVAVDEVYGSVPGIALVLHEPVPVDGGVVTAALESAMIKD